ncbi:MAG: metal-dependent hydrolase [Methanobacteriaceae archaeon]|nr:metal-dependent hydrolase [Methanobacteriaceae archaeon]
MILAHAVVGVTLGNYFGHFGYYLAGSLIPDVDHLFVLGSQKIFSFKGISNALRFEKDYGLNFKTKYVHSLLGAVVLSAPVFLFDMQSGLAFFASYIIHLLMDWPDIDDKYYLYPLKKKFSGFLPIFSMTEIIFTVIMLLVMLASFKNIV